MITIATSLHTALYILLRSHLMGYTDRTLNSQKTLQAVKHSDQNQSTNMSLHTRREIF